MLTIAIVFGSQALYLSNKILKMDISPPRGYNNNQYSSNQILFGNTKTAENADCFGECSAFKSVNPIVRR